MPENATLFQPTSGLRVSTKAMQKRFGKRWIQLHRLVYLAAISAVVHYLWLVKSDLSEPLFYAAIISALLGLRLIIYFKKSKG